MVLQISKAILYIAAITAYLVFFTSEWAMWVALMLGGVALICASQFERRLNTLGLWGMTLIPALLGLGLSLTLEGVTLISDLIGSSTALRLADSVFFGSLTFGVTFGLRAWGRRRRFGVWVEGIVISSSVVQLFATHRGGQLHEPRFFSDWVIISGDQSIQWWLTVIGVGATLITLLMLTRVRRAAHLMGAFVMMCLILGGIYWLGDWSRPAKKVNPITFSQGGGGQGKGGSDQNQDGKGGGDGSSEQPRPDRPPTPVAVAVFHDDYEADNSVLYFRQQVLSSFDGAKLVSDTSGRFDQDVITQFPYERPLDAAPVQVVNHHVKVSTSMYLIDEHPTPPALTHAVKIAPLENPAPQRFVAAYSVDSMTPAVSIKRYVGRASIPSDWSAERRAFYLSTHTEDPRYQTLAEEIVRDLPSYLSADPIYKAMAIKRYLEREGYYTLKVKHRSTSDPAAPFLFGDLRGYCVHFAHSAVHLLRSQGIAARVALGYAVDARTRSNSSAVLITGDRAHAWPEIHIDGVGWVTFDIYPEQSDEPPPQSVSQSLESLFGEIARNQVRRGVKRSSPFPWVSVGYIVLYTVLGLVALGYLISLWRTARVRYASSEELGRLAFLQAIDRLSSAGFTRAEGESRERFARRMEERAPGLIELTDAHLGWALGDPQRRVARGEQVRARALQVRESFAKQNGLRWLIAILNPFGWLYSR
jgi:transglutaminase-like putative cysteine protease